MADLRDAVHLFRDGQEQFRPVITGWMIDHESIGSAKVSDEPGYVYVMIDRGEGVKSGDVIKARGRIRPVPGWAVEVSKKRDRPWEYTILDVDLEAMGGGSATGGGGIDGVPILEYHHEMHEWSHPSGSDDVVYPRFMQLYDFGNWPGLGLGMNMLGGIINPSGTKSEVDYTGYDLAGTMPPSGQRYVLVCLSPTGTIELVPGVWDVFVDLSDIPVAPSTDHWEIAAVKVSFGETQIIHTPTSPRVVDLRFARLGWPGRASPQYVLRSQWLQNGFIDPTDVSLSWDDATRTLTVAPVGDSFDYLHGGLLYTKTVAETITIADTEGMWVIYYDALTLTSNHTPSEAEIDDVIENQTLVCYVQWDATNNDGRLQYELHEYRMSPATHHWIHDNIGAVYKEGMALADFVIDASGDVNTHAQFSAAAGKFYDEDIENELAAIASGTGLEIWYLSGADWRWTTNAGYSILTTGSGRMAYNNAGAQTEVGNNRFALCHVFATNITADDGTGPRYIAIQGQNEYITKTAARTGADTEINDLVYGDFPLEEVVIVGTIIFQTSNGYGNAVQSRTISTDSGDDYVDWRSSNIKASGGSIADHGSLAGLEDDDHPGHPWLAGRGGGQILYGGTAAGEGLTLYSTAHATKGTINLGDLLLVEENNGKVVIDPDGGAGTGLLTVRDTTIDTTVDYYGIYNQHIKTVGASNFADDFYGIFSLAVLNQAAGEIGIAYGAKFEFQLIDGSVGAGGNAKNAYGAQGFLNLDGGTVTNNAFGINFNVDQEAANTVSGSLYGAYIQVDADGTVAGSVYNLRLVGLSNVDYGIHQAGANANYFANPVRMGVNTTRAQLTVDNPSEARPVAFFDQGDVSEEMFEFATTIGVGNAIEALGGKSLTPTHFIKVTIPGALTRYFQVGTIA